MHYMYQLCRSLDHMHRCARGARRARADEAQRPGPRMTSANAVLLLYCVQKWNLSQRCQARKYLNKGKNFYVKNRRQNRGGS